VPIRFEVSDTRDAGGQSFRYEFASVRASLRVGRTDADIILPDPAVPLRLAVIESRDGAHVWQALDGAITLNGAPTPSHAPFKLRDGDVLVAGPYKLQFFTTATSVTAENTVSVAHKMVRTLLRRLGQDDEHPHLEVTSGAQTGTRFPFAEPHKLYVVGVNAASALAVHDARTDAERIALIRDELQVRARWLGTADERERALTHDETLTLANTTLRFHDPAEAYLRSLESAPKPTTPAPQWRPASSRKKRPRRDLYLLIVGATVAIASGFGLIALLR
jgi:hypothetical protein